MVEDIDNAEKCMCRHIIWETSTLSTQFCYELKTALKGKVYLKIIIFKMVPMVKIYVMCLVV